MSTEVKTVWIPSNFVERGSWITESIQVGTTPKVVSKGVFKKEQVTIDEPVFEERKKWVVESRSDRNVDGGKLTTDIENAIKELVSTGFRVVNIIPITSGQYDHKSVGTSMAPVSYGYGWSYTNGVSIVAIKE